MTAYAIPFDYKGSILSHWIDQFTWCLQVQWALMFLWQPLPEATVSGSSFRNLQDWEGRE